MKIITIGSKILSDALLWNNVHHTRVTNISPFVYKVNSVFTKNNEIILDQINDENFINTMNQMEISGTFGEEEWDRCLIDCADMRMSFKEYIFEDGDILRLTCSHYTEKINVSELVGKKIVDCMEINPMEWSLKELEMEIFDFLNFLQTVPAGEILFCDTRFPLHKIGHDGIIRLTDDFRVKYKYNNFLMLCANTLKKNWKGTFCALPENIYRDENVCADNFWGINKIYYQMISDFALDISKNMDFYAAALEKELNGFIYKVFQNQYSNMLGKKQMMCVEKSFFPDQENIPVISWEELKKITEYPDILLIINPLYMNNEFPEKIKRFSLIPEKDFYIPAVVSYDIQGFQGEIKDVFGNQIVIKTLGVHLKLNGSGNNILIEDSIKPKQIDGCLQNFSNITIKTGFEGLLNISIEDFGNLYIDSNTSFREGSIVNVGCFGRISIGRECMFSSYVKISDKRCNLQIVGGLSSYENAIEIGEHVWGGYNCYCTSGARVGSGCIIGAKALVDKDYSQYKNCVLAGNPAKVKDLGGVSWNRDVCATNREEFILW